MLIKFFKRCLSYSLLVPSYSSAFHYPFFCSSLATVFSVFYCVFPRLYDCPSALTFVHGQYSIIRSHLRCTLFIAPSAHYV